MTHQQNFANDRMGTYVFRNLVQFIKCHTNIRLKNISPTKMAELYFHDHPKEKKLRYTVRNYSR